MLVQILDGAGLPHYVSWPAQDQINDGSGVLGAGAVGAAAVSQIVAAANANRAGFLFQNTSVNAMLLLEAGAVAGWLVNPGGFFPPIPGYPIPTGVISVQGLVLSAAGDTFTYREWVNAPGE
jgi:hypothetical protein